jgi:hypothetical protein
VPAADVLPRDTELVGDLGLRAAGGEQLAGDLGPPFGVDYQIHAQ